MFVEPLWPIRQYMTGAGGARVQTTARMTADGDLNNPMVDNIDYQADMTSYLFFLERYTVISAW